MSVNGVEIGVGQTWRLRNGDAAIVTSLNDHPDFPVSAAGATVDSTWSLRGEFHIGRASLFDFVSLVAEPMPPAARPPVGDALQDDLDFLDDCAIAAMQGALAAGDRLEPDVVASEAFDLARAMLEERRRAHEALRG